MIEVENRQYKLIENSRDGFDKDEFVKCFTNYFEDYDYIVGDWAYGKLRLKGFNDKSNKGYKKINDIDNLKDYIENYCAYGCKYFVLKKIKG